MLTLERVLLDCRPLISAGASLHWLLPGKKRPIAERWADLPTQTFGHLKVSHRENANIGIRPGAPSKIDGLYLHLIDLDIRKAELAPVAWAALLKLWPDARSFPKVISGSGGESRHIYFLSDKPFSKKKLAKATGFTMVFDKDRDRDVKKFDWEIDILGTGSQAVIPPSIHPDTSLPYTWEKPLDLDFPAMMEISSELVERWGASETRDLDDPEDDDIESLFLNTPIDLDDGEINRILDDLPSDWVDDRDQWLTVGAALHHQFEGTNEGFEIWCEWSKQSPKFDAKDSGRVWKSFKGSKNPVRLPTLIQAAAANRMSDDLDLELEAAPASSTDLTAFLGTDIPAEADTKNTFDPDWQRLLHRNEEGELKSTLPNMIQIVKNDPRTRSVIGYNEFSNEIVLRGTPGRMAKKRDKGKPVVNLEGDIWNLQDTLNGDGWTDSHDIAIRAVVEAPTTQGGFGVKTSDRDLRGGIDMAAQMNRFHPVREEMLKVKWDGVPRAETMFIDYLGTPDTPYHRQTSLLTLMGIVVRVFEPGHKFDFVPILEGLTGTRKSTFIKTLGLKWFNELTGDITDHQSMVELMMGSLVLELGELSTMSRHDVNDLKAFVTRTEDKVRLAYAKRAVSFKRQCIFIGSTNDDEYLRDVTGNRRFWPIKVGTDLIDTDKFSKEIHQIYAEVVVMYREMRRARPFGDLPLYLQDNGAAIEAREIQESRRVETTEEQLAGQIGAWLDTSIGSEDGFEDLDGVAILRNETCSAQIWAECLGRSGSIPQVESTKIGKALNLIKWKRTVSVVVSREINKKYGHCRVYDRPLKG